MVYDIETIEKLVAPIAAKHRLPDMHVFGSYAENAATESSDIDFLIENHGKQRFKHA